MIQHGRVDIEFTDGNKCKFHVDGFTGVGWYNNRDEWRLDSTISNSTNHNKYAVAALLHALDEVTYGHPSGYRVYHKNESGAPDLHTDGDWYFEPADHENNETYSNGYATEREAWVALNAWVAEDNDEEV